MLGTSEVGVTRNHQLITDGRTENELVTHQYTSDTLEIFDEARRQGGYVLPEGMEKIGRVGA